MAQSPWFITDTSTVVSSSASSSNYATPPTFTAVVTPETAVAPGTPTGAVDFYDGIPSSSTYMGQSSLTYGYDPTAGTYDDLVATWPPSNSTYNLPSGNYSIYAVYQGDANFTGSTSSSISQSITDTTTTAISSSSNSSLVGNSVTFTAVVAPQKVGDTGTPTGTVNFYDGPPSPSTYVGQGSLGYGYDPTTNTWDNLVATWSTSGLALGSHSVNAVYQGDANFSGSNSTSLGESITNTSTTVTSSSLSSDYGQSVSFTATVSAVTGTPTGTVEFYDETTGQILGTIKLNSTGTAALSTSLLVAGNQTIEAIYDSSNNAYLGSKRSLNQDVSPTGETISPVMNPIANQTIDEGGALLLQATATAAPGHGFIYGISSTNPNGSMPPSGASINPTTGSFSWTPENMPPGTYTFTVLASANTNFEEAANQTFQVQLNASAIDFTGAANQSVAVSATLSMNLMASEAGFDNSDLVFSLRAGAPPGATISTQGAFSWTPSDSQPGQSYAVPIQVINTISSDTATTIIFITVTPSAAALVGQVATTTDSSYVQQGTGWVDALSPEQTTSVETHAAGSGDNTAGWSITGLDPTKHYDVYVSWPAGANFATNAPFTISDDNTLLATQLVNQQLPPEGPAAAGQTWQELGNYAFSSGTLNLLLSDAANGTVAANAVRVVAAAPQGSGGSDAAISSIGISDINLQSDGDTPDQDIPLTEYFSGDDLSFIAASDQPGLVSTQIEGGVLVLDFAAGTFGTANITVRATDAYGNWADESFSVSVTPFPPTVTEPFEAIVVPANSSSQTIDLAEHLAGEGEDDGAKLTYSLTSNSGNGIVSSSIADDELTLSFLSGQSGTTTITIEATDSFGQSVSATLQVTVVGPPIITQTLANVAVLQGADADDVSLENYFEARQPGGDSDIDNSLTYTATAADSGVVGADVDGSNLNLDFSNPGRTTVTVVATDSFGQTASQTFYVFVDATPTIGSLQSSATSIPTNQSFTLTAQDVDDETSDIASVTFYQGSSSDLADATNLGNGTQSGTDWTLTNLTISEAGSQSYFAIATDVLGNASQQPPELTVTAIPSLPASPAILSQTTTVGSQLTFSLPSQLATGYGTTYNNYGYSLDSTSAFGDTLPNGATIDSNGNFSWTPIATDIGIHYITVRMTASDSSDASITATFQVTVNAATPYSLTGVIVPQTGNSQVGVAFSSGGTIWTNVQVPDPFGNSWEGLLNFTWPNGYSEPNFGTFDYQIALSTNGTGSLPLTYELGAITAANGIVAPNTPSLTYDATTGTEYFDWNWSTPTGSDVYTVPIEVYSGNDLIITQVLNLEVSYGTFGGYGTDYGDDWAIPMANNYDLQAASGMQLSGQVASQDTGPAYGNMGDPKDEVLNEPAHAEQFQLNANGSFTYTPAPGFIGTDTFTYQIVQTSNESASGGSDMFMDNGPFNSNVSTVSIDVQESGQLTITNPVPVPDNLNLNPGGIIPVYVPDPKDPNSTSGMGALSLKLTSGNYGGYFNLSSTETNLNFYYTNDESLAEWDSSDWIPVGQIDNYYSPESVYVAGQSASQSVGDDKIELNWSASPDGSSPITLDTLALTVVSGELTTTGNLLPVANPASPSLVPLVLHATTPQRPGTYTLQIPSGVTIYQNADGTEVVTGATTFDASQDTTVYVAGNQSYSGQQIVKLVWSPVPFDDSSTGVPTTSMVFDSATFDIVSGTLAIASPAQSPSYSFSGSQALDPGGYVPVHQEGITTPGDQAALQLTLPTTAYTGGYYTLNFDSSQVTIWTEREDSQGDDSGDEVQSGDGDDSTQFAPGSAVTLYVQGVSQSSLRGVNISLNYVLPGDDDDDSSEEQSAVVSTANVTVVDGQLSVVSLADGTSYTDEDNDPQDAYRTTPGTLFQVQLAAIAPSEAAGYYKLVFNSTVNIWLDQDRQQPVVSGETLTAAQLTSLYASLTGAALTTGQDSETDDGLPPLQSIQLLWTPDAGGSINYTFPGNSSGGNSDISYTWGSGSTESGGGLSKTTVNVGWMTLDQVMVGLEKPSITVTATDEYAQAPSSGSASDTGTFVFSRGEQNTSGSVTVNFELDSSLDDAAVPGTDFSFSGGSVTQVSGDEYSVTISGGSSSVQLTVTPLTASGAAWDKTVQITLESTNQPDLYTLGDDSDDDDSDSTDGSEDADTSGDAASDGMQATVYILNQNGIGAPLDRNIDTESTGQTEDTSSQGPVTIGLQEGDVSLSLPGPDGDLLPSYNSNDNVIPLVQVDMTLPTGSGTPDSVTAELTFYDAADNSRLTNSADFSTDDVPSGDGTLQFVLQGSHQIAEELATGQYDYTVRFTFDVGGETHVRTVTGATQIINLTSNAGVGSSQFGAGWSVDSVDSLVPDDGSSSPLADNGLVVPTGMALIRGDGTSAYFAGTPNYNSGAVSMGITGWSTAQQAASSNNSNSDDSDSDPTDIPITTTSGGNSLTTTGDWQVGTDAGLPYLYNDDGTPATATWTINGLTTGRQYQVLVAWNPGLDRTDDAPYLITGADPLGEADDGLLRTDVDQQETPGQIYVYDGQDYRSLGFYTLPSGQSSLSVELDTSESTDSSSGQEFVAGSVLVLTGATTYTTPAGSHLNAPLTYQPAATSATTDTYTFTEKDGTQYVFDDLGRLTNIIDRNQNNTVLAYSDTQVGPDGHYDLLTSITQQGGFTTTYDFDGDGQLDSVTDAAGLVSTFDTAGGELTSYSAPNPGAGSSAAPMTMSFGYSGTADRLSYIEDGDDNATTLSYGADGRVDGGVNADGGEWQFTSLLDSGLDQIQAAPSGDVGPDSDGQEPQATLVDPDGNSWYYQTDIYGLMTAESDPTGAVWTWQRRDPSSATNETGSSPNLTDDGLPTQSVEPSGGGGEDGLGSLTTTYVYDGSGNLTKTTYPPGSNGQSLSESWSYGVDAQVSSHTDPAGLITTYGLDNSNGNVTSETEGATTIAYTYTPPPLNDEDVDSLPGGLVLNETVSGDNSEATRTTTVYYTPDNAPSPMSVGQPESVTTGIGIESNGDVDSLQQGVETDYSYDSNGNLSSTTLVMSVSPSSTATGLADRATSYVYDALGQLIRETDSPANGSSLPSTTTYAYDGDGNQISVTDALGNETDYQYDPMGRLTETILPVPGGPAGAPQTAPTTITAYDFDGNVTSQTDADGNVTRYTYDDDGNEKTETDPANSSGIVPVTYFSYDALGELESETDPRGFVTEYGYDSLGNQTQVIQDAGGSDQSTTTTKYNGDGQATEVDAPGPNGVTDVTQYGYDTQGRLLTETDPDPLNGQADSGSLKTTYAYNNLDEVTSETQNNAAPEGGTVSVASLTTQYAYNTLGFETGEIDPDPANGLDDSGSPSTAITYDNAGDPLTTTVSGIAAGASFSRTTRDTYDADGNLIEELGPAPGVAGEIQSDVKYAYNADGNMVSESQQAETSDDGGAQTNWAITTFGYNNDGEQDSETDPALTSGPDAGDSPETDTVYDADGNVIKTETMIGPDQTAVTSYEYDNDGNQISVTDPDGHTSTSAYDADGDLTSETDARDYTTTFHYDDLDRQTESVAPGNLVTTTTYDLAGDVLSTTDPRGYATSYEYDDDGNQIESIAPGGIISTAAYDLLGNALTSTGAHLSSQSPSTYATTSTVYNAENLPATTTIGSETSTSLYDSLGEQIGAIDARGAETKETLDANGQDVGDTQSDATTADDADGSTTTQVLSPSGQVLSSKDALGQTTYYTYDDDGNELSEIDPNGQTITYQYNLAGEQIAEIDSDGGNTTETDDTYDLDGNLLSQAVRSGGEKHTTSYQYNGDGELTQETDPNNQVITYGYDADGRETSEQWKDSSGTVTNTITFGYDADGDMISASDDNSSYTFGYDTDDRPTTVDNAGTPGSPHVILTNGYGDVGQGARGDDLRTSLTASGDASFVNTYLYDQYGNETSVSQSGTGVAAKTVNFTYDLDNNLATVDRYAGDDLVASSAYSYDLDGRITSLTNANGSGTIDDYGWTYDADNRVSTFTTTLDGTATYGYDTDGQLESASYSGSQAAESFSYDAAGNRTSVGSNSTTVSSFNQVLDDGTYQYSYDADGNLTRQTSDANGTYTIFAYDVGNQLTSATLYTAEGVKTEQITYTYDMFNNLIGRTDTLYSDDVATSTTNQRFIFDDPADNGQMLLTFTTTDGSTPTAANLTDRYLWGPAVDQLLADEKVTNPDSPGNVLWTLTDDQQTIRDVVNSSGELVDHTAYNAFGQQETYAASGSFAASAAVDTLFAYTGKYTDPVTGLQWNQARWYNPASGTFLTPDPAQADVNTYRYADNGPTDGDDPKGESDCVNCQAICGLGIQDLFSRSMALRMTRSFLRAATRATLNGFPAARSFW